MSADPVETVPYCWNSRRWMAFGQVPGGCPYKNNHASMCFGGGCGYYEDRKATKYIQLRIQNLKEALADE